MRHHVQFIHSNWEEAPVIGTLTLLLLTIVPQVASAIIALYLADRLPRSSDCTAC